MINVTRLDNTRVVINADLIEFVEAIPETIICLTTGKKIMVKETIDDIIERVAAFKRRSMRVMASRDEEDVFDNG
jgi:flagellar protein FlbD